MEQESNSIEDVDLDLNDVFKINHYEHKWSSFQLIQVWRLEKTIVVNANKTKWKLEIVEHQVKEDSSYHKTIFSATLIASAQELLAARIEAFAYINSAVECRAVVEHNFRLNESSRSEFGGNDLQIRNLKKSNYKLMLKVNIRTSRLNLFGGDHCLSNILDEMAIPASRVIEDLLLRDESKDVLIRCNEGITFKAHKFLLIARSEVFRLMFCNDMKEARENIIKIEDIEPEIVDEMLSYIYTDRVELKCQEKLMQLLLAADKYQMDHLKLLCQKVLLTTLSVESSVELLAFSDFQNLRMKKYVLFYVAAHAKEIFKTEEWRKILSENSKLAEEVLEKVLLRVPDKLVHSPKNLI